MTNTPSRALLLSGGLGTRLRPLTDTVPKCLVQVRGKPVLGYWIDMLFGAGVERILINTHYLPEQVEKYCNNSDWCDRIDLVHEDQLLGTAGTLRTNHEYFRSQGTFFVAHADNLSVFDPDAYFSAHMGRPTGCIGTIMTFETDQPQSCGILELDAQGVVQSVFEKVANPPGNLANGAVFLLETEILDWVCANPAAFDFCGDVVPSMAGKWYTFFNETFHRDIGTIEALKKAESDFVWNTE
ncbi:MAG: nucleotidyltransferase family protein [Rhodospirillaceae bacterium]|jgi:mannose-1-phosphate guanylyltransferase|nr:nucleotidyltransferase family protein [Rhodospirillaceae bacterium]MBT5564267.1 nucleotidyltransferase family protein [Rhodospirillaceae bacterium]MBT6088832.1 nucleotidyltransferase family protein [Rhodospirillaceae bacterium]MBT6962334.1 nucleotidyltransferase family protein [Rhodospirillaceae bacterium]MBT7449489.1 nucleotidyltransferase family protein [Rhodospirillaceae bacterium]